MAEILTRAKAEQNLRDAENRVEVVSGWLRDRQLDVLACRAALAAFDATPQVEPLVIEPLPHTRVEDIMGEDETRLLAHHRSGCGENSNVLRELFIKWLNDHNEDGVWLYTNEMCRSLDAWTQHGGKQVVDFVLESLRDIAEFQSNSSAYYPNNWPYSRVRLKPRHT